MKTHLETILIRRHCQPYCLKYPAVASTSLRFHFDNLFEDHDLVSFISVVLKGLLSYNLVTMIRREQHTLNHSFDCGICIQTSLLQDEQLRRCYLNLVYNSAQF